MALSDRMVSFYMMTPIFGLLYAWLRRGQGRILPIPLWLLLATLLPLALDGGAHLVSDGIYGVSNGGFRDTNVWLAWLTRNAWPGFYAGDHFGTFNWSMIYSTAIHPSLTLTAIKCRDEAQLSPLHPPP